jgi:hypothetical protein
MVKGNNFESRMPLLTFIFLFSGIMACTLNPYNTFAIAPSNQAVNSADDEIATFDEYENAAFDPESITDIPLFLHAEHYQPSVYLPERQKRSLTSYAWMHIIPFTTLVMLALATTRLFGRRREKSNLNVQSTKGHVND